MNSAPYMHYNGTYCFLLRNLTSKVSKNQDEKFVTGIFSSIEEKQRSCIILVDEVYVKTSLQYHGGHVFGKKGEQS